MSALRDELGPDEYERLAKAWRETPDKRQALILDPETWRSLPARYIDHCDE